MSDEIIPEQLLTIPPSTKKSYKDTNLKAAIVRLHVHDHKMLKLMLKKDELTFQKFIFLCVRAYLDGDPQLLKCLKTMRELETIPLDIRDKHVLSHRERADIYKELEAEQKAE